jgi:hypothetical protein
MQHVISTLKKIRVKWDISTHICWSRETWHRILFDASRKLVNRVDLTFFYIAVFFLLFCRSRNSIEYIYEADISMMREMAVVFVLDSSAFHSNLVC